MSNIAIVVVPEAFPHSIIEPLDVFSRCETIYKLRSGQQHLSKPVVSLVGETKDATINYKGVQITPTSDVNDHEKFDFVWVPSLVLDNWLSYKKRRKIISWIYKQHRLGAKFATVCTGSFLLAESGILNHQTSTLHWSFSELFQENYPLVNLAPHLPVTESGGIFGVAADADWIKLALKILELEYGKAFSSKTAEMFLFSGKGKKNNNINIQPNKTPEDAIVLKTQSWLSEHISEANLIARAAHEFGLSESSLTRRFKSARSESVINYIQYLRIERTKEALELTNMPVEKISDLVGYRDSSYFRRLFKGKTGMTPKEYRKQYSM